MKNIKQNPAKSTNKKKRRDRNKIKGKRNYKDSLFCFLFGSEKFRKFTLDLYNAVNNTNYTDSSLLTFRTMKDVLYINVKNDVSFLIKGTFNFYEHQSSFNPNIPVRMFIYAAHEYNRYINDHALDVYSSHPLTLPVPKFICFYNGERKQPDEKIIRFSDSFKGSEKPDVDIAVRMLNINYNHNKLLLQSCKPLADYSAFVHNVRSFMKGRDKSELDKALTAAISNLPDDSVIKPILLSYRSEVFDMCLTEYTQEHADKVRKIEARKREREAEKRGEERGKILGEKLGEERGKLLGEKLGEERGKLLGEKLGEERGKILGEKHGELKTLSGLVADGILTINQAAQRAGMTVDEFKAGTEEMTGSAK
jgi:hypothetical protein